MKLVSYKHKDNLIIGLGATLVILSCIFIYYKFFSEPQSQPVVQQQLEPIEQQVESEIIHQSSPTLVLFYADWCPHCTNFKPTWENVKRILKDSDIKTMEFENDKDASEIQKVNDIKGYPELRYYPQGYPSNNYVSYSGDRSEESVIRFAYTDGKEM